MIAEPRPTDRDPLYVDFLGIRLYLQTAESLLHLVAAAIRDSKRLLVGHQNLHGLSTYTKCENIRYRRFFEIADLTLADGMSMVILGKLLRQNIRRENRIAYNDWLPIFLQHAAEKQWKVFYLGSAPEVASRGKEVLSSRYSGLQIACHHGHFDAAETSAENSRIIARSTPAAPTFYSWVWECRARKTGWLKTTANYPRVSF
jgi:N-acetylglucosaminyldiphosphoundecaprenol N-acetyl-beta-D-mannosaminyltransferase